MTFDTTATHEVSPAATMEPPRDRRIIPLSPAKSTTAAADVAQAASEPKRERKLIRIAEVAARFGVTRSAVYAYAAKDAAWPEPVRIGGSVFYVEADIERYLDGLEQQAASRGAERAERIAARNGAQAP